MAKPQKYGLGSVQKRLDDSMKLLLIAFEIERARQEKKYVSYLSLAKLTGLFSGGSPLARLLGILFEMDVEAGLAPRTALVVHYVGGVWGEPGKGFFEMCVKHGFLAPGETAKVQSKIWTQHVHEVWGIYQDFPKVIG